MIFKLRHIKIDKAVALVCLLFASCNYTKHLTDNQTLLDKNKIKLQTNTPIKNKAEIESGILSLASPQPNSHLLDLGLLPKFKLWKYNNKFKLYSKDTLNPKIARRKVEKPALIDTLEIKNSEKSIRQYMFNQGYFYSKVNSAIIPDPKKAKTSSIEYSIEVGKSYTINEISYESESPVLLNVINETKSESFLKKGEHFNSFKCVNERDRLYKAIRNYGFYDFKSDNVSYKIDTVNRTKLKRLLDDPFENIGTQDTTSTDNQMVNILVRVLKSKDSTFSQKYQINKILVEIIDYNAFENQSLPYIENTLDHISFRYKTLPINRNVIARNIFIQPGDVYNVKALESTINRLNQLGVFQFVNFKFEKDSLIAGSINCTIVLNTAPKMDLIAYNDISTSDGDYKLGLGAGLTYKNKNLFHGANQLQIRTSFSTEFRNDKLLTGEKKFYQSGQNFNVSTNLIFPKFIVPFNQNLFNKKNLPFTILGLNYSFIQRIQNYAFINISGSFGYTWQETAQKNWRFNPAFLTVTKLPQRFLGDQFKTKLEDNKYLQNIFSDNVIYGENVSFEYNSKFKNEFNDFTSMKFGLEEAGTILTGINSIYNSISDKNIQPIARYVKVDGDIRKYKNWKKIQWVNRAMFGVGIPIGNNNTLPFIKQYSAGGAFSNRGWRARTLGPGRAADSSYQAGFNIIDRTGDIKFEANSEVRFNLLQLFSGAINLKGAAFVDAGNIWLFKKSANIPGGEINMDYLWQDIAISSGAGMRLDFSFFVFRVDYALPVKQPQLLTNSGWALDQLKYKSGVWNIAIGYPF